MYTQPKPDINTLSHYGVLGMKWGVRRYQPYGKGEKGRFIGNLKEKNRIKKEERSNKLSSGFKERGLTKEEADRAAQKRMKIEKALKVAGVVTVTAATAYVVKNQVDLRIDKKIDMNMELQRITGNKENTLRDAFYATMDKKDNEKYKGLFGQHLINRGKDVYIKQINTVGEIKVASRENSRKIMETMLKNDKNLASDLKSKFGVDFNGKLTTKQYEKINRALPETYARDFASKFYGELKNKGYGAIQDINDMKYSGFRAKNPLIIFDSSKVDVTKSIELGKEKVQSLAAKENKKLMNGLIIREVGKIAAAYTLIGAASVTIDQTPTMAKAQIVGDYRKQHPNSKLSSEQIIKKYKK